MSTIAAISTPPGVGGIAVVRLSGSEAWQIASHHLSVPKGEAAPAQLSITNSHFSIFRIGEEVIDEVVATWFRGPHSFTGEDTVEISCHGSLYVQQTILQALFDSGAVMAEPGEFTRRAFLNGRLDLSQAEAVADLIDSTNAATHALAVSQLRGGYAKRLKELRDDFVRLASLLELELDFSEEDVEFADRQELLHILGSVEQECLRLCDSFRLGNAVKNGVPVAIVGRPNVGKSTLLNALLGEERAIVSDIAGTTRDTIEDTLVISGITFRFIDTAGIRHSDDQIESLGIERSYRAVQQAEVILYMIDAARASEVEQELEELRQHADLTDKHLILLFNKTDLLPNQTAPAPNGSRPAPLSERGGGDVSNNNSLFNSQPSTLSSQLDSVQYLSLNPGGNSQLSAENGSRSHLVNSQLDSLRDALAHLYACPDAASLERAPLLTNVRHHDALLRVLDALAHVREGLTQGLPSDLVVIDLRDALYHLGTITGQVSSDEVLGTIFRRFCIGK